MKKVENIEFENNIRLKINDFEAEYNSDDWDLFELHLAKTESLWHYKLKQCFRKCINIVNLRMLSIFAFSLIAIFAALAYNTDKQIITRDFNWQIPQNEQSLKTTFDKIEKKNCNCILSLKSINNRKLIDYKFRKVPSISTKKNIQTISIDKIDSKIDKSDKTRVRLDLISDTCKIIKEASTKSEVKRIFKLKDTDKNPEFHDGWNFVSIKKMEKYIRNNVDYKFVNQINAKHRKIKLTFKINENGELVDLKICSKGNKTLDNQIKTLIKSIKKWMPAEIDGNPVSVKIEKVIKLPTRENKPFPAF